MSLFSLIIFILDLILNVEPNMGNFGEIDAFPRHHGQIEENWEN